MARILKPLVRGGGCYPSNKWIPLVKNGGYTTQNGGGDEPEPPTPEVWKTITGSIVSFVTSVAYPMRKLLAQIEPQQDLHGYDAPWAGGSGKNLFDPTANPDKWINSSGQLTTVTGAKASQKISCAQGDTFTVSTESGISTLAICFYASDDSVTQRTAQQDSASLTATAPANTAYVRSATYGESGKEVQLEKGSSKTSFLPYANECPITGWTGLSGWVEDEYDPTEQPTFSVSWQTEAGTVYGGTVDVVTGVLTVDWKTVTIDGTGGNGASLNNNIRVRYPIPDDSVVWSDASTKSGYVICDMFPEGTNAESGTGTVCFHLRANGSHEVVFGFGSSFPGVSTLAEAMEWITANKPVVCYKLAESVVYQLTGQQISTLLGNNTVFVDTGDIEVEYRES